MEVYHEHLLYDLVGVDLDVVQDLLHRSHERLVVQVLVVTLRLLHQNKDLLLAQLAPTELNKPRHVHTLDLLLVRLQPTS